MASLAELNASKLARLGLGKPSKLATLSAPNPSLRDRIGNMAYDAANYLGLPAQRFRDKTEFAADFVPGLGDTIGAQEASRDYQAGNYLNAAIGGGLTALGVVPVVGKAASKGLRQGIKAYHGSPHSFDKFSMDKIGTGEGAQVYGHGLYFAESEKVAKDYRERLGLKGVRIDGQEFDSTWKDELNRQLALLTEGDDSLSHPSMRENLSKEFQRYTYAAEDNGTSVLAEFDKESAKTLENTMQIYAPDDSRVMWTKDRIAKKREILSKINPEPFNKGSMYEVNIDANPDDFLDWDAPLSEQNEKVQDAYRGIVKKQTPWLSDETIPNAPGDSMYHLNIKDHDEKRKAWQEAGIPGIKYKDAGSRGVDGEGTRNFVVFDENLISIVKKYGVAGAVGLGLVSQADGEAIAAQLEQQEQSLGSILSEAMK